MNNDRRRRIASICTQLDAIREERDALAEEEREAFDNMPESLQASERGQASEGAADALDTARDATEEAISSLGERSSDSTSRRTPLKESTHVQGTQ